MVFQYFVHYKLGESYTNVESAFVPFFLQYLALSAQLPNVIFNWINVFFKFTHVTFLNLFLYIKRSYSYRRALVTICATGL